MSASMHWERPPVEVEQHGVSSRLRDLLAGELFGGDLSSSGDATIEANGPLHQSLRGGAAALSYVASPGTELGDFAEELDRLLACIERWGSVRVLVVR